MAADVNGLCMLDCEMGVDPLGAGRTDMGIAFINTGGLLPYVAAGDQVPGDNQLWINASRWVSTKKT